MRLKNPREKIFTSTLDNSRLEVCHSQGTHKHHRNLEGRISVDRDTRLRIHFENFPHYSLHIVELGTRDILLANLQETGS